MIIFANCKINIGLDVLRRGNDGYHDISTLMYPVSGLADSIEILRSPHDDVYFTASGIAVDCPAEQNLCLRAYNLIKSIYNIGGVRIHLHKCVPFGAGLGGGSSDATAVIVGLNALFSLSLSFVQMQELAARLGSDTAFFVRNVPQMATGRGEVLCEYPLPQLSGKFLLIVKPDIAVSTADAYARIVPSLPLISLEQRLAQDISSWRETVGNAFEEHIFELHPSLAQIKRELYGMGAIYASMSGSGAAIFGFFDKRPNVGSLFSDCFVYQQVIS